VGAPLLETKLYRPRSPRGVVSRRRLGERLERGTASKLALILHRPALARRRCSPSGWRQDLPGDVRRMAIT
jgi:hypothetical protein